MKTVILKWNPAFSSFSMLDFLLGIHRLNMYDDYEFNWSVWDHEQIHAGDKFYWAKVGRYGQVGIVGTGTIVSEPYADEDWSGQGRQTFYVEYKADVLLNPDAVPILTAWELQNAIPDFEWNGGHSGLVLTDAQAARLDALWKEMMQRNAAEYDKANNLTRGSKDLVYIKN